MKRLIKRAEKITLYHTTEVSNFIKIMNDGEIKSRKGSGVNRSGGTSHDITLIFPANYDLDNVDTSVMEIKEKNINAFDFYTTISNNSIRDDIHINFPGINAAFEINDYLWDDFMYMWHESAEQYNPQLEEVLSELIDEQFFNSEFSFNPKVTLEYIYEYKQIGKVKNYNENDDEYILFIEAVNEMDLEGFCNSLKNQTITIQSVEYRATAEDDVVFLGTENVSEAYAQFIQLNKSYKDTVNFSITMAINTDTNELGPDLNDSGSTLDFTTKDPLWKQTLNNIGQCTHMGPIPITEINSVKIVDLNFTLNKNICDKIGISSTSDLKLTKEYIKSLNMLTIGQYMSPEELISQTNQLVEYLQSL